jgi:hypothetical protein
MEPAAAAATPKLSLEVALMFWLWIKILMQSGM